MPKNAADVLYEFFKLDDPSDRSKYNFVQLAASLDDIRLRLDTWRQIDATRRDAEMFDGAVNRWLQALFTAFAGDSGLLINGNQKPQPGDMSLLKVLSDKLDANDPPIPDEQRAEVSNLVNDTMKALAEDDSLPKELRLHLATLLVEIQKCLLDYEIGGDFRLSAALERLMAVLQFAESQSSNKKAWHSLIEKYFQPIMVGLMINAPQTIMTIAALTTGTAPTP